LPPGQEADLDKISIPGVKGCVADPCKMGFPPNDIRAVVNTKFLEGNPAARRLFEIVEIPLNDFSSQNAKMFEGGESKDEDIIRHAKEWIDANQVKFDGWIEDAKKAVK
jgi:glycine betaine/proline transport system substrate-binding protein